MKLQALLVILMLSVQTKANGCETPPPNVHNTDVVCLALTVYHEGRGELIEGQEMIAWTVLNRVASARYPTTICEVVWAPGQFSWTTDNVCNTPNFESGEWKAAFEIAENVVLYANAPPVPSTYFLNPKTSSVVGKQQVQSKTVEVAQVGRHVFYARQQDVDEWCSVPNPMRPLFITDLARDVWFKFCAPQHSNATTAASMAGIE